MKIVYTNYKGTTDERSIVPIYIKYEKDNKYHGDGFILHAYDYDKKDFRGFSIKDIHNPECLMDFLFKC